MLSIENGMYHAKCIIKGNTIVNTSLKGKWYEDIKVLYMNDKN